MLDLNRIYFPLTNKSQKVLLFLIFFLACSNISLAQYTDVINSNKPGFSESPYSVGVGIYQFESNLFLRNTRIEPIFSRPQSLGANLLFRTSFLFERLELNAQATYQQDKVAFKNIFTSHYFASDFSNISAGAKYLIYQKTYDDKSKEIRSWKKRYAFDKSRLIPSIALYLGVNAKFLNERGISENFTPKIGLLLQHNLTKNFNIITNVFYDNIGSDFSERSIIITATQNFSNRWSAFLEQQSIFQKSQSKLNIGIGFAYLYSRNLQFNTSGRFLLEGKTEGFYAGLGVSYRINQHRESFKITNTNSPKIKDTPISIYNKKQNNFFTRLFRVFKKKDKSKKERAKRVRKQKKTRKVSKRRRKETDIEKLEREIKELEKEIKKEEKRKKKNGNN